MRICFTRKQQKNKGPPPPLKKEKKFGESNSGSPTWKVNALFIAPQPNTRPAARCCLKPAKPYLWRIERYIRGKQAGFWQLKPHFNSFCRIGRTYGCQVSRKTVVKSLSACDSRRLHEEKQLRFSDSKHFRFYWTNKHFSAESYSLKTMRLGVLSWEVLKNRATHDRIVSLDQLGRRAKKLQKTINFCIKVGHSANLKHSKSTLKTIVLWLLWNVQNQPIAERERSTTVVVLISGAFVRSRLIYERCLHLSDTFAYRSAHNNLLLTLRVIHKLTR